MVESKIPARMHSKVSVEHGDTLIVGNTIRIFPTAKGWRSEICIEQIVTTSQSLLNLGKILLGDDARHFHPIDASATATKQPSRIEALEEIATA